MALLVTRSKEFSLYDFDFVKDVDLMTPEVLYKGRRKNLQIFGGVPSVYSRDCACQWRAEVKMLWVCSYTKLAQILQTEAQTIGE